MALVDRGVMPNGATVNELGVRGAVARRAPAYRRDGPGPSSGGRFAPVRTTADLESDLYGFLRGYAQARDVAAADVIRELIRQVRADPHLSAKVTAELERRREALAEAMRAARE